MKIISLKTFGAYNSCSVAQKKQQLQDGSCSIILAAKIVPIQPLLLSFATVSFVALAREFLLHPSNLPRSRLCNI
jgi:hypothetical protein